jgi:TrmH family RNA methyltransferase
MSTIKSLQNARVKAAVKLRDRRGRDKQGRFVIDGPRELEHALAANVEFTEVFYCAELVASSAARDLLCKLKATPAEVMQVTTPVWRKLAYGGRRDGIVAVANPPARRLADIRLHEAALIVVLDDLEKPGNVGAIIRSADATGADGILVVDSGTDLYNPNTIRASIGTIFRLPVVATSRTEAIQWLHEHAFATFLARVNAGISYTEPDYRRRCAIVMGSEAAGLGDQWNASPFQAIQLPMHGAADSLNVAVAAAVLLYEVVRQRQAGRL